MTLGLVWFAGIEEQQWGRVAPEAASQSPILSMATKQPRILRAFGAHRRSQSTELETEAVRGLQSKIQD